MPRSAPPRGDRFLSEGVSQAAREHAESVAPRESCGVVVHGGYRPQRNAAPDPAQGFRIDDAALISVLSEGLQAVIHSHPHPHPPCPSRRDMEQQIASGVPWAIVPVGEDGRSGDLVWWGPGVPLAPLVGRSYVWGIHDCFSVGRDWYGMHGIDLPDYPREWRWWDRRDGNPDLFERHFRDAGFYAIDAADARVGDALLMQVSTDRISHCGVIAEPGVMLHHPSGSRPCEPARLSRRDPIGRWQPYVRRVVRHAQANIHLSGGLGC